MSLLSMIREAGPALAFAPPPMPSRDFAAYTLALEALRDHEPRYTERLRYAPAPEQRNATLRSAAGSSGPPRVMPVGVRKAKPDDTHRTSGNLLPPTMPRPPPDAWPTRGTYPLAVAPAAPADDPPPPPPPPTGAAPSTAPPSAPPPVEPPSEAVKAREVLAALRQLKEAPGNGTLDINGWSLAVTRMKTATRRQTTLWCISPGGETFNSMVNVEAHLGVDDFPPEEVAPPEPAAQAGPRTAPAPPQPLMPVLFAPSRWPKWRAELIFRICRLMSETAGFWPLAARREAELALADGAAVRAHDAAAIAAAEAKGRSGGRIPKYTAAAQREADTCIVPALRLVSKTPAEQVKLCLAYAQHGFQPHGCVGAGTYVAAPEAALDCGKRVEAELVQAGREEGVLFVSPAGGKQPRCDAFTLAPVTRIYCEADGGDLLETTTRAAGVSFKLCHHSARDHPTSWSLPCSLADAHAEVQVYFCAGTVIVVPAATLRAALVVLPTVVRGGTRAPNISADADAEPFEVDFSSRQISALFDMVRGFCTPLALEGDASLDGLDLCLTPDMMRRWTQELLHRPASARGSGARATAGEAQRLADPTVPDLANHTYRVGEPTNHGPAQYRATPDGRPDPHGEALAPHAGVEPSAGPQMLASILDDFMLRWADGSPVTTAELLSDNAELRREAWAAMQAALLRVHAEHVHIDCTPAGNSMIGLDALRLEPHLALVEALGGHEVGTPAERAAVAELRSVLLEAKGEGLLGSAVLAHVNQMQAHALVPAMQLLALAAPSLRFFQPPNDGVEGVSLVGRLGAPAVAPLDRAQVPPELVRPLEAAGAALAAALAAGAPAVRVRVVAQSSGKADMPLCQVRSLKAVFPHLTVRLVASGAEVVLAELAVHDAPSAPPAAPNGCAAAAQGMEPDSGTKRKRGQGD